MIDRYFAAYPRVRAYLDETVAEAHRTGYAETLFGRRRHIPELRSGNYNLRSFGERTAMNHPMQGTAADIMKLAMIAVDGAIVEAGLRPAWCCRSTTNWSSRPRRTRSTHSLSWSGREMQGVAELSVPLVVDVSWGENWAVAK